MYLKETFNIENGKIKKKNRNKEGKRERRIIIRVLIFIDKI